MLNEIMKFITPDFYLEHTLFPEIEGIFEDEKTLQYVKMIKTGVVFPPVEMVYCNYEKDCSVYGIDGRHRAAAAKICGTNKIPVIFRNKHELDAQASTPPTEG